ncbi:uncharacterized protein SAPINGB_P002653 [Magnusiomyces paraingens]|uniref:Major facilitator superfamily (MFS) profile domain-containing protein n=1 Tax=Magnusiomyces paraingens TaxID=2606893 RepID=A0A5E8BF20_9ASCO|nr:uncharacterized protein SAPINGB_P002653 [Saprochaete ingens]VVT50205.1 unnamed protein product [Saprochaete ingens]
MNEKSSSECLSTFPADLPTNKLSPDIETLEDDPPHSLTHSTSHIDGMLDPVPPYDQISLLHEIAFVFVITSAQIFTQASVAQTIVAYRAIGNTFGISSIGELSWYSSAYSLTVGTFILIAGRLGDMYGLKRIYIAGMLWFAFWSLVCGLVHYSKSSIFFSVCRALQGIGPAFINPTAAGIFGSYYPVGPRRVLVMCIFGGAGPTGFTMGSLFSGLITQLGGSWPWFFYAECIACAVFALLSYFFIPANIGHVWTTKQTFDYLGAITGVCGLILFNFAWNQGPVVGWSTPYVYVLLIVGVLFLALFLYVEHRVDNPLLPPETLRGDAGALLGCIAAGWSCFGIWIYYVHRFGFEIEHRTMLNMTARLCFICIGGVYASLFCAYLLPRVKTSWIMLISMCGYFFGNLLTVLRPANQIFWAQMFVSLILIPFGMDMSFPAATVILSQNLPQEKQGVAGSVVNTVVNYSISIGLGIAATVEYYSEKNGHSEKQVIRNAQWTGTGLGGLGVLIAAAFVFNQVIWSRKKKEEK